MSRHRTGVFDIPRCRCTTAVATFWLLTQASAAFAAVSAGASDPVFERLQFHRWAPSTQSHMKWSVEVPPAELSTHQRLMFRVVTKIDGRELEKRRGEGELVAMLQVTDSSGHVWQNHTSIDLSTLQPDVRNREFQITHYAFVRPGDYSLSIALCDSRNLDHNVIARKIHVDPVKDDPLPHAFDGLPTVEFVPPTEGNPDVWFIPDIESRLNLTLRSQRRLELQVVVNTTPSQRALGSGSTLRRNMSLVIPAMKLLTGVQVPNGSTSVSLLDLERHQVAFEQPNASRLDWAAMSKVFGTRNTGMVDVRTLANEWKMRAFFLDQISRSLQAPLPAETVRVVIVLSGPAFFEDPNSVVADTPSVDSARHLYYVRLRTPPVRYQRRNRPGMRPPIERPLVIDTPMPPDDLEKLAIGLNGKIFDATSTEQFRRILATMLHQISLY
jgi:hypothetical protein